MWESFPAKTLEDKILSSNPDEGFIMGFLYITDNMDLSISSELLIN